MSVAVLENIPPMLATAMAITTESIEFVTIAASRISITKETPSQARNTPATLSPMRSPDALSAEAIFLTISHNCRYVKCSTVPSSPVAVTAIASSLRQRRFSA